VLFLIQAAGGVSEAYDWIEQLFDKLGSFTQRMELYLKEGSESMNANLQQKIVAVLSCLLEIIARSEQAIKDGRWKKYAVALFLGKDGEIKRCFSKLTSLFDDEERLVLAISYMTSQKIERKNEEINRTTKETLEYSVRMDSKLDGITQSIHGMYDEMSFP
jgi:hypothetical protein